MRSRSLIRFAVAAALAGGMVFAASAADRSGVGIADTADKAKIEKAFPGKPGYSPYAGRQFPTMPLFGDTHLHTGFSMDAARSAPGSAPGMPTVSPAARRSPPTPASWSSFSPPARLSRRCRPLGWHRVLSAADGRRPRTARDPQGRKWYDQIRGGKGAEAALDIIVSFGKGQLPDGFPVPGTSAYRNAWMETIKAAEAYNDPVASRPSSATSGHPTRAATTCTAT